MKSVPSKKRPASKKNHPSHPIPVKQPAAHELPARVKRRLPTELSSLLHSLYTETIIDSAASLKKASREVVRQHLDEVHRYPDFSELSIRDKLWTLSKQIRKTYNMKEEVAKKKKKNILAHVEAGIREMYGD